MYNLPDQYYKSLLLIEKYNRRGPLPEGICKKLDKSAEYFFRGLESSPENLWTLRRIVLCWYRTIEWERIKKTPNRIMQIISFVSKLANGVIESSPNIQCTAISIMTYIMARTKIAGEKNDPNVLLSLRCFTNRIRVDNMSPEEKKRISFTLRRTALEKFSHASDLI